MEGDLTSKLHRKQNGKIFNGELKVRGLDTF